MAPVSKTVGLGRVTTQVLPYFSFPFKGKAGMGMGSLRCHFYSIPTLTLNPLNLTKRHFQVVDL